MHKHSIEDYKHVIDGYLTEEDDEQIKSDIEFEKIYSEQFHLMFDDIETQFIVRLKDLKSELEKRLDIKYNNEPNNESFDESENECDNESLKSPPSIIIGKHKLFGRDSHFINPSEEQIDEVFKNAELK